MRGYFGIGVEGVSKPGNVAALMRTAHAFGADFLFTVGSSLRARELRGADTSEAWKHVPLYMYPDAAALRTPRGSQIVGVELDDGAIELPSFRHPRRAVYVLGPERGDLSDAIVERCEHLVRIPSRFALNIAVAGALVMYDRLITLGRFAPRPVRPGGPTEALDPHEYGDPVFRRGRPAAPDAGSGEPPD